MMRYVDPVTGKQKTRSTRTSNRRNAERAAAKWEAQLLEGRYHPPTRISWSEFRERYEDEKLASLSANTFEAASAAFNHLEAIVHPQKLEALNAVTLSQFQAGLRKTGMRETSIASHLRHIRAALSWGVSMDLLPKVPAIQMPKRSRGHTLMRGRPLTQAEFDRMLAAVPDVRPHDTATWIHYLRGLWLSGLRLEESIALSWERDSPIAVELNGRRPRLRIFAEAEKGHQDRLLPLTPDFADFLALIPARERIGPVFKLTGVCSGQRITPKRISRIVSAIGAEAKIVVNHAAGKFASAHDLRRSFGTRWSGRVKPATLQLLMRHKSIETTLKYYVEQDADEVADELWRSFPPLESEGGAPG